MSSFELDKLRCLICGREVPKHEGRGELVFRLKTGKGNRLLASTLAVVCPGCQGRFFRWWSEQLRKIEQLR